jgi:hypothetical protein
MKSAEINGMLRMELLLRVIGFLDGIRKGDVEKDNAAKRKKHDSPAARSDQQARLKWAMKGIFYFDTKERLAI